MLSFIKNWGYTFREREREEIQAVPDNPGRGWYRIYTYHVRTDSPERPVRYDGESLALVLLDVGAYRDREFDPEALAEMDQILSWFVELGFELILRICYDTEGKGMVREPSLFSLVKKHISQISPLLKKYQDAVFVYQGLLVGNWGEMHESKYLSAKCLKEMATLFLRETGEGIPLALRRPVQYRMAFDPQSPAVNVGFFNDGILGSETHLGTFAEPAAGRGQWQEMWAPDEEIAFMRPFLCRVPYGGEVLLPNEAMSPERMLETLRGLQVSYLNSTHEEKMLLSWKNLSFQGQSFYDYIGQHMGYRLLLQRVSVKCGKTWECTVEIENVGFGCLYEDAEVLLWAEEASGARCVGSSDDTLSGIGSGETRRLTIRFGCPGEWGDKDTREMAFSVSLRRKRDARVVLFAQKAVEGRVPVGSVRKGRT